MNEQLLQELSRITPEEQRILDGDRAVDQTLYSSGTGFVIDSGKMLEAGRLIQIRTHTRFVHFPKHTHNYVEMIYMCSGETRHIINETEIRLCTGELLILNQHAAQEILPASAGDVAVNFIILPEFFDETLRMMGTEKNPLRDFLIGCLNSSDSPVSYLHFKVSDVLPVQNLLENLVWTIHNDIPNLRLLNQYTMGLLFLLLMNQKDRIEFNLESYEHKVVMSTLQYIEEHYRNGELTEIANRLDCELSWLSRTIKKLTGFTWLDLCQQKRMEKACELLTDTSLSVTDISLSVGYENFSYFHRLFHRYYGVSPRTYRIRHRAGRG